MASASPLIRGNSSSASTMASVANEFLQLQREDSGYPVIDQMKLQKLLFYSHAWYLAMHDRQPLFDDDFEAWPWGPVVRDAYFQTREFGKSPVTNHLSELEPVSGVVGFQTPEGVDGSLKNFVRMIWDVHKGFTGIQLSNSTHAPGEPWSVVKDQYGSLDSKPKIPNSLIADIFEAKMRNAPADTTT